MIFFLYFLSFIFYYVISNLREIARKESHTTHVIINVDHKVHTNFFEFPIIMRKKRLDGFFLLFTQI